MKNVILVIGRSFVNALSILFLVAGVIYGIMLMFMLENFFIGFLAMLAIVGFCSLGLYMVYLVIDINDNLKEISKKLDKEEPKAEN